MKSIRLPLGGRIFFEVNMAIIERYETINAWVRDTKEDGPWIHVTKMIDILGEIKADNNSKQRRIATASVTFALNSGYGLVKNRFEITTTDPNPPKPERYVRQPGQPLIRNIQTAR